MDVTGDGSQVRIKSEVIANGVGQNQFTYFEQGINNSVRSELAANMVQNPNFSGNTNGWGHYGTGTTVTSMTDVA